MKKTALFAIAAGLLLAGTAPPPGWGEDWEDDAQADGYPPCSRKVTDRCIQLYERGVANATNLALNERLGMNAPGTGMGGPFEPVHGEAYHDGEPSVDNGEAYADDGDVYADGSQAYADDEEDYGHGGWPDEDESGYDD